MLTNISMIPFFLPTVCHTKFLLFSHLLFGNFTVHTCRFHTALVNTVVHSSLQLPHSREVIGYWLMLIDTILVSLSQGKRKKLQNRKKDG